MLFKTPDIAAQFPGLHPELRVVLHDLEEWLDAHGISGLTITDAARTPEKQEELYLPQYLQRGFDDATARRMARAKFSWHLVSTAADFRGTKAWSEDERQQVTDWLEKRCPSPEWERLFHDAGTGFHHHLACRDFLWRRKWEQSGKGVV